MLLEASSPLNHLGESSCRIRTDLISDIRLRYLVDTDQEVEGLAVIADFQGKALDDELVLAEYKEIRDAVLADVRRYSIRERAIADLREACRR